MGGGDWNAVVGDYIEVVCSREAGADGRKKAANQVEEVQYEHAILE